MSKKLSAEQIDSKEAKALGTTQTRKHFKEPKLTFIEPKLTKHGDATKITGGGGFFGTLIPPIP